MIDFHDLVNELKIVIFPRPFTITFCAKLSLKYCIHIVITTKSEILHTILTHNFHIIVRFLFVSFHVLIRFEKQSVIIEMERYSNNELF